MPLWGMRRGTADKFSSEKDSLLGSVRGVMEQSQCLCGTYVGCFFSLNGMIGLLYYLMSFPLKW